MRQLAFILTMLLASVAFAQGLPPTVTIQTAVALNGSQAARTSDTIPVAGFSTLRLTYHYTRVAGTDFTVHCEESDDLTTWRVILAPEVGGYLTKDSPVYRFTSLTTSLNFSVRVGVGGYRFARCYPTVTSAGASDLVTTTATLMK